jgi:ribose 5-phosphate isomerase B
MKIYIGTDHAGFELKEELKKFLENLGYEVEDMGAYEFSSTDDYPDFVFPGLGNGILANKVKGIRAGIIYDEYSAKMSREHNDANVMALGARTLNADKAKKLVKIWLDTPFSNEEKHKRRIEKIKELENDNL